MLGCIVADELLLQKCTLVCLQSTVSKFYMFLSTKSWPCVSRSLLAPLQINEEYDTPQIIIQVFPLEVQFQGVLTFNQTSDYLQYMSSLYTAAQAEGMTNVHLLQLNGVNMPLDNWCVDHPSAAADVNIAAQLTAYIEAILPQWSSNTYPLSVQV